MPLYVADYIADTGHLSTLEHGAYFLLLMHYWATGGLPANAEQMSRICRMDKTTFSQVEPTLKQLFIATKKGWKHKRLDAELKKTAEISQKRSDAARSKSKANAKQMPTHTQPHTHKKKSIKKKNPPKVKKVDLDDMKAWARERGLTVNVAGEYEKYLDWKKSIGRRHENERAGFRNWLRKAQSISGDGTITPKTADQVEYDAHAAKLQKRKIIQAEIRQAKERAEKYGFDLNDDLARISKEHGEPMDQLRSLAGGD
jgi:uncharacterized protein YdaU (DUF1376 family)